MQQSRKKKGQKKGVTVPLSELGFKSKLYEGIQSQYKRRRVKYKQARFGNKNGKQCFMSRLSFMFDVTTLTSEQLQNLPNFKGSKRQQWLKIKYIMYNSQDELKCAICLDTQFKAPQMTNCGHIFCWTCIYMHHFKSLKANNCPVCNEVYYIESVITCKPNFNRLQEIQQKRSQVKLSRKIKKQGDKKIFNSQSYTEDINFTKLIKATPQNINQIFQQQKSQLLNYYRDCDDEQIKVWIGKILSLSYEKIQKLNQNRQKRCYKLKKHEKQMNGIIATYLQDKTNLITFYQQFSGKFIFLHPLCYKYLKSQNKQLPLQLQQQILYWQQAQYNLILSRKYKEINHIMLNQQIDLIIINLSKLISQEKYRQFVMQFEQFKIKRCQQIQKQERQSQRLQKAYQEEQEYIKKIKKLQESQFFDIKTPVTIDLKQIGDNTYFPSLIQTKSMPQPQTQSPKIINLKVSQGKKQKVQDKKFIFIKKQSDFPELFINSYKKQEKQQLEPIALLTNTKSLEVKPAKIQSQQFPNLNKKQQKQGKQIINVVKKKNNKRKKQKFINVTDQFFQHRQQQDY